MKGVDEAMLLASECKEEMCYKTVVSSITYCVSVWVHQLSYCAVQEKLLALG